MLLEIKKTKVEFGFSFVLTVTLMLYFFDENIVLMSVLSSMLHESGHLLLMILFGEKIERVVFGAFGVRIEKLSFSGISYKKEVVISLGGIGVNLLLALLGFAVYNFSEIKSALMFSLINIFIALMNSLPLKSLDMGKALRYYLLIKYSEEKTEIITERTARIFIAVFCAFTIFYCIFIKLNFSLIAVCIYLLCQRE